MAIQESINQALGIGAKGAVAVKSAKELNEKKEKEAQKEALEAQEKAKKESEAKAKEEAKAQEKAKKEKTAAEEKAKKESEAKKKEIGSINERLSGLDVESANIKAKLKENSAKRKETKERMAEQGADLTALTTAKKTLNAKRAAMREARADIDRRRQYLISRKKELGGNTNG